MKLLAIIAISLFSLNALAWETCQELQQQTAAAGYATIEKGKVVTTVYATRDLARAACAEKNGSSAYCEENRYETDVNGQDCLVGYTYEYHSYMEH